MSMRHALGGLCLIFLLALTLSSCSDDESLLNWSESNRDGLSDPADTLVSAEAITAGATYWEQQATGRTSYFLVGRVDRAGLVEDATTVFADAYLKWDLTDLPEGTIVSAKLEFVLHDLDDAGTTPPESFNLRLFEVTQAWEEDSLGLYEAPLTREATSFGNSGAFDVSNLSDTLDVSLPQLFVSPGDSTLMDLVNQWLDDPSTNHGVAVRAADETDEQGFLRFVAREGTPIGAAYEDIDVDWPKLTLEVQVAEGDVEIRSLTAVEDGFQFYGGDGRGGFRAFGRERTAFAGMDSETQLLLSSGYVQPMIFKIELDSLMAEDPQRFPKGLAIHQATLELTQILGDEWSMTPEDTLWLEAFTASTEWSEDDPPEPGEVNGPFISSTRITHDDETVSLDVRSAVQRIVEGEDLSIVVLIDAGPSVFRTILFQGRNAGTGAPALRTYFTRPSDGRIPGVLEQGGGE